MVGNHPILVRLDDVRLPRLQSLAGDGGDATLIKDWLEPLLAQVVTIERDKATGRVLSITGLDAEGRRVTIVCGKPIVKGAQSLPAAPKRGRPRKAPEGG